MKKLLLSITFIAFTGLAEAADPTRCECGAHASGITAYTVTGSGCCDGSPEPDAWIHHYELNQGAWSYTGSTSISGAQAQKRCCGEP